MCCTNKGELCACTKEYMPVIAGGEQYNNFCLATCAGYDEDEIINMRVKPSHKEILKKKADKENLSVSTYCRVKLVKDLTE